MSPLGRARWSSGRRLSWRWWLRRLPAVGVTGVAVAVLLGAGLASAAWLSSGGGTATARGGQAAPPTTTTVAGSAITSGLLYPGSSGDVKITVNNPNTYPVTLTSVTPNGSPTASGGTGVLDHRRHADRRLVGDDHPGEQVGDADAEQRGVDVERVGHRVPERDVHHPGHRRDHERMRRPVLVLLVATLLLLGGGVATAAWRTTNTGTATAKAGSIGTPTGVVIGTITCTTSGLTTTATIPVSWNAVSGATQYTVEAGRVLNLVQAETKTVTGTSTTFTTTTLLLNVNVRVTASAGNWTGTSSATVSKPVGCSR